MHVLMMISKLESEPQIEHDSLVRCHFRNHERLKMRTLLLSDCEKSLEGYVMPDIINAKGRVIVKIVGVLY